MEDVHEAAERTQRPAHAVPRPTTHCVAVFASGSDGDVRCALTVALKLHEEGIHVTVLAPARYRTLATLGEYAACSRFIAFPVDPMTFFWGEEADVITQEHTKALLSNAYSRWVGSQLHSACVKRATEMCNAAAQAVWLSSHFDTPATSPRCAAIVCCGIRALQSIALSLTEAMQIPLVNLSNIPEIPTSYFSHPLLPFHVPFVPRLWSYYIADFLSAPVEEPLFNIHRRHFGLPPLPSTVSRRISKHPFCYTAGMWSTALLRSPPDWPNRVISGPLNPLTSTDRDEIIRAKLALDGFNSQFILANLTHLPVRIALAVVKMLWDAIGSIVLVVLLSSEDVANSEVLVRGWKEESTIGSSIHVISIPHALSPTHLLADALPRCVGIIHDGAPANFYFALTRALPSLPIPLFDDTHWWAARMHRKGHSAPLLTLENVSDVRRVSAAITELRSVKLRDAVSHFRNVVLLRSEVVLDDQVLALILQLRDEPPQLPPLSRLQRIPPIVTPLFSVTAILLVCYCYSKAAFIANPSTVTIEC